MKKVTEEMNEHVKWLEEASLLTTPEQLAAFVKKLTEEYDHDYGTIVKAMQAAMKASFNVMNESKQGGITGFQAGFLGWWAVEEFMSIKAPARILEVEQMLYPQYEYKFNSIDRETFEGLQKKAKQKLAEGGCVARVTEHMQSIVDGVVPFGYTIREG